MSNFNFKEEKDIKEFLNNIFLEYSFACLSERKSDACHLLGDYYETVKRNFKEAADIYKKNCDSFDFPKSCSKFGGWSIVGKGCPRDLNEAHKYLKKACMLNVTTGCLTSGILATSRPEVHKNQKTFVIDEGVKVLQKCCDEQKSDKACFYLSGIYITGIKDFLDKSMTKAHEFSLKACDLGNSYACANISQMYIKGHGVPQDPALADKFRKKAAQLEKEAKDKEGAVEYSQGIPA